MQLSAPPASGVHMSDVFEWLKYIVNTLIIPYGVYLVKRMDNQDKKLADLSREVSDINVTLLGQNKQNGLNGRVKEVERILNELRVGFAQRLGIETRKNERE